MKMKNLVLCLYLCVSGASANEQVTEPNLISLRSFYKSLDQKIAANELKGLKHEEKSDLKIEVAEVLSILKNGDSWLNYAPADQKKIITVHGNIVELMGALEKRLEKQICTTRARVGTNFRSRECISRRDYELQRENATDQMRQMQGVLINSRSGN